MRNICLVNRYYPPNPAVTGEAACGLAEYLSKSLPHVMITIVHVDAPYSGGGSLRKPVGNISSIKTFYSGRNKLVRFAANFIEGHRLVSKSLNDADLVISLTDPPLLNYWAGKYCNKKNIPWVYWSMDVYPHAFKAAGLADEENIAYKYLERCFKENQPSLLVALGALQAEFIQNKWRDRIPQIILPCGIHDESPSSQAPVWKVNDGKIYFAYVGNLGEAHDPDFILDFIDCLDERKHRFVLASYGSKANRVIEYAQKCQVVEVVKSIDRSELRYLDVHLVSLLPEWTNVCVPSKALSAVCAGQTFLFSGVECSDTWQMLHEAGWLIPAFTGRSERKEMIKSLLSQSIVADELKKKKQKAELVKARLLDLEKQSYLGVVDWIKSK